MKTKTNENKKMKKENQLENEKGKLFVQNQKTFQLVTRTFKNNTSEKTFCSKNQV